MTKDTFLSLLRTALTMVGTFIVGRNILGQEIDASLWQELVGAVMASGSILWGIIDKPTNIEGWQSAIRSLLPSVGGILLAHGIINQQMLTEFSSFFLVLISAIQSYSSRVKVKQMAAGSVKPNTNGKLDPAPPKIS